MNKDYFVNLSNSFRYFPIGEYAKCDTVVLSNANKKRKLEMVLVGLKKTDTNTCRMSFVIKRNGKRFHKEEYISIEAAKRAFYKLAERI